jgi:hypothetical protein
MCIDEIARVLRKTQTHIKVLLFRARMLLGRELEKRSGHEEAPTHRATLVGAKTHPHKVMHCLPTGLAGASPGSNS